MNNQIENIIPGTFKDLQDLQELQLINSYKIDHDKLDEPCTIEQQTLNTTLVSYRQTGLCNSTYGSIIDERITNIARKAFQNYSVEKLLLDLAETIELEPESLDHLPSLQQLHIKSKIVPFNENLFTSVGGLSRLEISFDAPNKSLIESMPKVCSNLEQFVIVNSTIKSIGGIDLSCEFCAKLKILDITESKIELLSNNSFASFVSLENLYLSRNQITNIPSVNAFDGCKTSSLFLSDNNLKSLKPGCFDGLTLDTLIITVNELTIVTKNVFNKLNSLRILELGGNYISSIDDDAFSGLALQTLGLGGNNLTIIQAGDFRGLTADNLVLAEPKSFESFNNLKELRLIDDNLTDIKPGIFDGLNKLKYLKLTSNKLTELKKNIFNNIKSLGSLDLANNKINIIEADTFSGLNLTYLSLSKNNITVVTNDAFRGLVTLTDLTIGLEEQELQLEPDSFNGLPLLKILRVELGEIPYNKEYLKSLDLAENKLTTIPGKVFEGIPNIEKLFLSTNEISLISQDSFTGLKKLKYLYLDENKINKISPDTFSGLNLKELLLSNNNLNVLKNEDLRGLSTVQLTLSNNQLEKLEDDVFKNIKNFYEDSKIINETISADDTNEPKTALLLDGNNLTQISQKLFDGMKNLDFLSLENDKITCDIRGGFKICKKSGVLLSVDQTTHYFRLYIIDKEITSIAPNAFKNLTISDLILGLADKQLDLNYESFNGLPRLKLLEFESDILNNLRPGTFDELDSLKYLYLNWNGLTSISKNIFNKLVNVVRLELAFNKIKNIEIESFSGMIKLQILKLQSNQIKHLENDIFIGIPGLRELNI
ncbi:insulin-like growth factor-binding protein complex acid labile subunit [Aphidius gifuensis]|uniref:insulin-like growth factor-binding protein complex acid labile subunit n=1 Tax=Aphidius gifuensis TaxID=684658 RepID=UPI001CDCB0AA|nr:insulin-like growth factor-binding protein complex acid labile subunit [Aphidius gifuensis]